MEETSKFRTTEISNPKYEDTNGLRFITVKSKNLKGRGDICLFVPEGKDLTNLPIVTLLHGVYGSAWIWAFMGGAHTTTADLIKEGRIKPMIIAMPSDGLWGDGSAYSEHNGYHFEKWIVEDVIHAVIENIPQASTESRLYISGLSMGGFGAMRIGAKYAKQYSGISGHSSMTEINQMQLFVEEPVEGYYHKDKVNEDVFTAIDKNKEDLPPLRFDCGTEDELISYNRELHQQLDEADIPHSYFEFKGGHSWEYWEEHLVDTLVFFNNLT